MQKLRGPKRKTPYMVGFGWLCQWEWYLARKLGGIGLLRWQSLQCYLFK